VTDRVRFHLNEHVAFAVAAALRKHGIEVTTTGEVGLQVTLLEVPNLREG